MILDYCQYSSGHAIGSYLIDILVTNFEQHGNLIQPCPPRHIYLKNYTIDLRNVPFVVPIAEYSCQIFIYKLIDKIELFLGNIMLYLELQRK